MAATPRRFVLGRPCPVEGHDHVLALGATAFLRGGYVSCAQRDRERMARWKGRRPRPAPEPESRGPVAMPDARLLDPRWGAAAEAALVVESDAGLWAAALVSPARYGTRELALQSAREGLALLRRRIVEP
jgi:hypothetical protein